MTAHTARRRHRLAVPLAVVTLVVAMIAALPAAAQTAACAVDYTVQNQWPGGFTANITITNNGPPITTGWTLEWTFPSNQHITQTWNATDNSNGPNASISNPTWNTTIPTAGTATFGFNGTWTTTNTTPTTFTLNGTTCGGDPGDPTEDPTDEPSEEPTDEPTAPPPVGAADYAWRNVEIGGGGFVPGIVFNQSEPNLIYARTDIGGAYRWNQNNQRWIPLLDWVGWDHWGYNGVVSLATDPVDPDRVYVAAGMYTNDWDPNNGAVLRSTDRGDTWEAAELPFKMGGNMPGRGMGERLAIDPNDNRILYLGTPEGNGLWRSVDSGQTWSRVSSFPVTGDYAQDPNDANGYLSMEQGIVWVTFDPSTGGNGSATQTLYVGVADVDNTVYRSTDGGDSWEVVPGAPTGYIAHKGVVDTANGYVFVATSNTGGPYDGEEGQVWRFDTASGQWTEISPVPVASEDSYYGYSGLTIDRQNPGTIMVSTQISWWPDIILFRSTDSGDTWTRIWDWAAYPNRDLRYTMDIAAVPWLTFGGNPAPPEVTPKLGG